MFFGWVFFLISSGSPHVRCTPMGCTCGGPDGIGLIPHGGWGPNKSAMEHGARIMELPAHAHATCPRSPVLATRDHDSRLTGYGWPAHRWLLPLCAPSPDPQAPVISLTSDAPIMHFPSDGGIAFDVKVADADHADADLTVKVR
jgi:hypothetical protein